MRFQKKPADHVSDMRAEFSSLDRVPPQLVKRTALAIQQSRHFGLTARHERNRFGFMTQSKVNGVVGGRIAGVQRGHHLDLGMVKLRARNRRTDELHPVEAGFIRKRLRLRDQIFPRFHADHAALPCRAEDQIVQDKAEVGFAGANVGEHRIVGSLKCCFNCRAKEIDQVEDLLKLAAGIRIQLSVTRKNMQRLQERL